MESVAAATQSQVSQPCCCGYLGVCTAPKRSALVRVGFGEKKKKTVQESSSIPVTLGEVLPEESTVWAARVKTWITERLLPGGNIPARMKKHASPFLCSCPPLTVLPCVLSYLQNRIPLLIPRCTSPSIPSPPFLPSPSGPCFPDTARALRTQEGTAEPLQRARTLFLGFGP